MQYRRISTAIFSAAGIFLLIMDGETAIKGATQGIDICIRSVIPSLFPFFVLGNLLLSTLLGSQYPILRTIGRVFGVPKGAESLLLIGFLGGYPVGAQTIAQAYHSGQLSKQQSQRMLAFCNQPGPAFLFGILGSILNPKKTWLLWGIQIISAFLVARCIPALREDVKIPMKDPLSLPAALAQGIRTMVTVCGWVILFRMGIAFLDRWLLWLLPSAWKIGITGLLELANGCLALKEISVSSMQFVLCAGILGFGGICVTMQTLSVTQGLSLHLYFPGKILQASISMLLACLVFPSTSAFPAILIPIILLVVFSLRKMENRSGNQVVLGV